MNSCVHEDEVYGSIEGHNILPSGAIIGTWSKNIVFVYGSEILFIPIARE